jgi:hypothetical protein
MTTIIQGGLFLVSMGLGIAVTQFILPAFTGINALLWLLWIVIALVGVFMIIKMKPATGISFLGIGLGIAATQNVFPQLINTPIQSFFWILWFILEIIGLLLIIWSTEH